MTITKKTQLLFAKMVSATRTNDRSAACNEVEGMAYMLLEDLSAESWYSFKNGFGQWLKSSIFSNMDIKQLANDFNGYLSEFSELKDSPIDLDVDGKVILRLVDTIY